MGKSWVLFLLFLNGSLHFNRTLNDRLLFNRVLNSRLLLNKVLNSRLDVSPPNLFLGGLTRVVAFLTPEVLFSLFLIFKTLICCRSHAITFNNLCCSFRSLLISSVFLQITVVCLLGLGLSPWLIPWFSSWSTPSLFCSGCLGVKTLVGYVISWVTSFSTPSSS